ncbi:hypothetical protein ACLMJK_002927 [Lecanora helva]
MAPIPPSFILPIASSGHLTCTQPSQRIYLFSFELPPDNRITPSFCATLLLALDIIDHRYPKGVVVTTSSISKFYSNGLDYESAMKTPNFFSHSLYPLWRRLLTYPMPTLALLPGHAFAGGFMTAIMHDYRFMNPHRGYLCLNELEFGAPLAPPMASIFRQKVPNPNTFRTMVLEAKRYNALEGLKEGFLDGLGGVPEVITFVQEMKLVDKAKSGVYGRLKTEMWGETVRLLDEYESGQDRANQEGKAQEQRQNEEKKRVEEWERGMNRGKSKL